MPRMLLITIFSLAFLPSTLAAGTWEPARVATVLIGGIDSEGPSASGVFGVDRAHSLVTETAVLLGVPTGLQQPAAPNQVTLAPFYGDAPPAYYTPADIAELQAVSDAYGGGIPRYAMIQAKFIRHVLDRSGALQVNVAAASMGALIARWMIEKDYEQLASEGCIARFITIEGVVAGNWASTNSGLADDIADDYDMETIDIEHMRYEWVRDNLHDPRDAMDNPLYADILVSHWATSDDDMYGQALTAGSGEPNDGIQLVEDMHFHNVTERSKHFGQRPTLSYIHRTHETIKTDRGIRAGLVAQFTGRTRVRATLTNARVTDMPEDGEGEVVFGVEVYSPRAQTQLGIDDAISEHTAEGQTPPLFEIDEDETINPNQILFDDFVLPGEQSLRLEFNAVELDFDVIYEVHENLFNQSQPIESGDLVVSTLGGHDYPFSFDDWQGNVRVDVIRYPAFQSENAARDWALYD